MHWELDSIFPHGSTSPEFGAFLSCTEKLIESFETSVRSSPHDAESLMELVSQLQDLMNRLEEAAEFAACLEAQNTEDAHAKKLVQRILVLGARFDGHLAHFDAYLLSFSDAAWSDLLNAENLAPHRFALNERRQYAGQKLPPETEAMLTAFAPDGYHAWNHLYDAATSRVRIPQEENGILTHLSAGQAHNLFSRPDRLFRQSLFKKWEEAWAREAEVCASALNHLAGFRLALYSKRKWSLLHETLALNRISEPTLAALFQVISNSKSVFKKFLMRKAELMGVPKLSWYDLSASLYVSDTSLSYEDARAFIIEQFTHFDPELGAFAEHAFQNYWIEAEDRPHKRPGAFCSSFPFARASRVFLTFGGTVENLFYLAHELGHAYHFSIVKDLPPSSRNYPLTLAETASMFAETLTAHAAVATTSDKKRRITILEQLIHSHISIVMNIHARFLFETRFYEARSRGALSVSELNALMETAEREAYDDSLETYHPLFWASKMHFYLTNQPFYNFPYAFGHLFSTGLYARAKQEDSTFREKYRALLLDTGSMTVEDLAKKHLGVDLTKPDFWSEALLMCAEDVEEFLRLTR